MRKTLVIGCSHAHCAYDKDNKFDGIESWAWHLHTMRKEYEEFYVISNPGQGILQYGAIIHQLEKDNLLQKFDNCIIQLTSEPRFTIFDAAETADFFSSLSKFENISNSSEWTYRISNAYYLKKFPSRNKIFSTTSRELYEIHKDKFNNNSHHELIEFSTFISDTIKNSIPIKYLYPIYYDYITKTLKNNNINVFCFDFWGKEENILLNNKLDIVSLMDLAKSRNEWNQNDISSPGGHHNSASNERLAKIINEKIIDSKKFK
jgi:hypothetical protein